jgi:3-hydroxy-9,10-secoandrosta-1,3,5(10)-triene-9,17-dione monooxygenase reductase component
VASDPLNPDINPFADPPESRDPVRRFRGRLVAPVTIVTAGNGGQKTGLTVSSLMVAEGEPGLVYFLVSATSDLYLRLGQTRRFVIHVCPADRGQVADVFAGIRPSPGGVFAGLATSESEHGQVIDDLETRAFCSVVATREESYSVLVSGSIDRVEAGDSRNPMSFYHGAYGRIS